MSKRYVTSRQSKKITPDCLKHWSAFINEATDIPASHPATSLPVSWAGVSDVRVPIQLVGFPHPLHASIDVGCSLSKNRRGVHMSRFVEVILEASARSYSHLVHLAADVADGARDRHDGSSATARISATGYIPSESPITQRSSYREFRLFSGVTSAGSDRLATHGVELQILTACPCTQAFTRYELVHRIAERDSVDAANELMASLRTETHVQRAWLSCTIQDASGAVGTLELVAALLDAVVSPELLLKRPDEHAVVARCHEKAQFTEDVVRDAALSVFPLFSQLSPRSEITLEAVAHESIHFHNASAVLRTTVEDLRFACDNGSYIKS